MGTEEPLQIVSVERQDGTEAIIGLSDGSSVVLNVKQIAELAAKRDDAPEDSPS